MKGYIEIIEKLAAIATLSASAGLIIGNIMGFLNDNAGGFGVIIGFTGLSIKYYFERKHYQLTKISLHIEKDE